MSAVGSGAAAGRVARFIVVEGGEASGKSTQASRLAARLGAVLTHEPGATALGARLRPLLLDPSIAGLSHRAEALMLAADRAQHVVETIRPHLDAGRDVVCDRYIASSLAYQGFGRGLSLDELRDLSEWAAGGLWPDLTVLLDVPPEIAMQRRGRTADRFEAEDAAFHRRVLAGYRALAASEEHDWVVIDGTASPEDVEGAVWSAAVERLPDLADAVPAARGDDAALGSNTSSEVP
jgi:dTMP kinase